MKLNVNLSEAEVEFGRLIGRVDVDLQITDIIYPYLCIR